jgi:protein-S-isoprenylcysteine O-methyltransferase Ste14
VIPGIVVIGVWSAALFGGAGTLHWTRGWIYTALSLIAYLGTHFLVRHLNPSVIEARANWRGRNTKTFDKIFLAVVVPTHLLQQVIAGLDAVRFGWTSMPFSTLYVGLACTLLGSALIVWTLAINPHAESTVRIQNDRGHAVISGGPYQIIRHPMYVGIMLGYVGAPLVLGSTWALAISGLLIGLFVVRTLLEDQTLRRELPGYEEYTSRTRYRLAPGLW